MTCVSTVHALLHIADDIIQSGPVWTSWCFIMERMCFNIKNSLTSRLHPYGTLNQQVKREAQLATIKFRYDMFEELNLNGDTETTATELTFKECE